MQRVHPTLSPVLLFPGLRGVASYANAAGVENKSWIMVNQSKKEANQQNIPANA